MTAKDLQINFIKSYLKPLLKQYNYLTSAQTWWKNMGNFFIVINLQNSQWNTKEELNFCFNIGVALTANLKDVEKKKATYFDISTHTREDFYLSPLRMNQKYRNGSSLGYRITDKTDIIDFTNEFKLDFESEILIALERLQTLDDCVALYKDHSATALFFNQLKEMN